MAEGAAERLPAYRAQALSVLEAALRAHPTDAHVTAREEGALLYEEGHNGSIK